MYLKRLEIHGFKSFAQKTTLEFNQGIIAIVGPNGSGKSNVADSLRWVLGEQSAKMIRGKKSDDVIFAGSEKKTKMGFAEVFATFDNRDRRIPVDAAEVSIGRRIDRSGESEYLINNQKVRLLDVVDLVLKSNIGTSRYTVIGQGTIDQMILAGPSEVKNLLDEASGVKSYYIKRERTLRRLEQTAQNLMRAEDLIAEIEPRLKSLRRQAKKMEARAEIEGELKILQREFFGNTYWQLKEQLDVFLSKLTTLEESKLALEVTSKDLRGRAEIIEKNDAGAIEAFRNIQNSLENLQKQKNALLEDLSLVRGKMQSQKTALPGDAKTLQVEAHGVAKKIEETSASIAKTESEIKEQKAKLSEKQALLTQIKQKLDALFAKLQSPGQMDWSSFEQEFASLDTLTSSFYEKLDSKAPWPEVEALAMQLREQYKKFKAIVKNSLLDPQGSVLTQKQNMELQKEKDSVDASVQSLSLDLSKSEIYLNFLQKDLSVLEQQKLHLDLELKKAQSNSLDDFWNDLIKEEDRIKKEVEKQVAEISKVESLFKEQQLSQSSKQKELHSTEMAFRDEQEKLSKVKDQISMVQIEKAKVDTQMEVLEQEIFKILGQEVYQNIQEKKIILNTPDAENRILKLRAQLEVIGGMDELTLKEYQETESRYTSLSTQVEDLKKSMQDLRSIMDELDEHIRQKFNESFHKINEKFEHYFRILFNGGRAVLSLVKQEDEESAAANLSDEALASAETSEDLRPEEKIVKKYEKGALNIVGIDIKATPPNKKLTHIQALSGGERSLTSIALLCSLLTCFPSPFVVLDEVDAALDDANTIRFGQILGTLSHQTQFVTITHNRETMSQANILYGVTMGDDGVSKLLSVKLDQAKTYAK